MQLAILEATAGIESRSTGQVSVTSDRTRIAVSSSAAIDIKVSSATFDTVSSGVVTSSTTTTEPAETSSEPSNIASSTEDLAAVHTIPLVSTQVSSTIYNSPITSTTHTNPYLTDY